MPIPCRYTGRVESYASESEYLKALEVRAVLPAGFRAATHGIRFRPRERSLASPLPMNLSLLLVERETADFGAVFTRNSVPGAPVLIGRERLGRAAVRGILVNNRISNVCTPRGVDDALVLLARLGEIVGAPAESFFAASTGIIGWELPVAEMRAGLPALVQELSPDSLLPMARAIMTTDAFPKDARHAQARGASWELPRAPA